MTTAPSPSSSSLSSVPAKSVAGKHPVFAQTMLRISDPEKSISFYEMLGLKYIATMAFPEYKFSLYFLIAPDTSFPKPPPIDAPRDVVSKYLWALRCPTLELTHNWPSDDPESDPSHPPEKFVSGNVPPFGYGHLALSGISPPPSLETFPDKYGPSYEQKSCSFVTDPDGYAVKVIDSDTTTTPGVTYARTMLRIHDPAKMVPFFERLGMLRLAVINDTEAGIDHYYMGYVNKDFTIPTQGINQWITNLQTPVVHLRHNWKNPESALANGNEKPHRGFGHLGIIVDDIYSTTKHMEEAGYGVVRKPSPFLDVGEISFVKDDDMTGYWIEIIARSNEAADEAYVKT